MKKKNLTCFVVQQVLLLVLAPKIQYLSGSFTQIHKLCMGDFRTHRSDCQFWGIVVDIGDADEGRGCVGQAEVQVALHVSGLDDDGVLGHFL